MGLQKAEALSAIDLFFGGCYDKQSFDSMWAKVLHNQFHDIIPGSSIVVIFGPMFITTLATVGCDPLLVAAMLPCICGVMCGITPPLGLGMYAGMTMAESDFDKTFKNNLWWVGAQFVMEVAVLMGWLPILGL